MSLTFPKQPGEPTLRPHADPDGPCALRRLLTVDPARAGVPWPEGFEGGIAHRLDVSTSGALWVADDPAELHVMRAAFAEGRLVKTYVFRAALDVPWDDHVCEVPLAHDRRRRRRMIARRGARTPHRGRWLPASTQFTRLDGDLWRAVIRTGVMHQIRVHAAFVGLRLAGDPVYGGGDPPDDAPSGASFLLHHVGLRGAGGLATAPVPVPAWCGIDVAPVPWSPPRGAGPPTPARGR